MYGNWNGTIHDDVEMVGLSLISNSVLTWLWLKQNIGSMKPQIFMKMKTLCKKKKHETSVPETVTNMVSGKAGLFPIVDWSRPHLTPIPNVVGAASSTLQAGSRGGSSTLQAGSRGASSTLQAGSRGGKYSPTPGTPLLKYY